MLSILVVAIGLGGWRGLAVSVVAGVDVGEQAAGEQAYLVSEFVGSFDGEGPAEAGEHLRGAVEAFDPGRQAYPVVDFDQGADG